MKKTILSCGVAAILALSAGGAMAGTLDPGLYNITFVGAGLPNEIDPVGITGAGSTRDIEFDTSTIHVTVTGASFSGTANLNGVNVTLTGTESGTGASGTFHATRGARAGNGTFTIAKRSGVIAHMQKASNGASASASWWDSACAWFASLVGGGTGPATPTAPTGSGSTSHGLATYQPH